MLDNTVQNPYPVFLNSIGNALKNGKIYIGEYGQNAEAYQVAVYLDEARTLVATQPLRTVEGIVTHNGSAAMIYAPQKYSILVKSASDEIIFSGNFTGSAKTYADIAALTASNEGSRGTGFVWEVIGEDGYSLYVEAPSNATDAHEENAAGVKLYYVSTKIVTPLAGQSRAGFDLKHYNQQGESAGSTPTAFTIHNYTDGVTAQFDMVGSQGVVIKAARNATQRPDKASTYISDAPPLKYTRSGNGVSGDPKEFASGIWTFTNAGGLRFDDDPAITTIREIEASGSQRLRIRSRGGPVYLQGDGTDAGVIYCEGAIRPPAKDHTTFSPGGGNPSIYRRTADAELGWFNGSVHRKIRSDPDVADPGNIALGSTTDQVINKLNTLMANMRNAGFIS